MLHQDFDVELLLVQFLEQIVPFNLNLIFIRLNLVLHDKDVFQLSPEVPDLQHFFLQLLSHFIYFIGLPDES